MYKVLSVFADLQDFSHIYNVGDEYPRKGYSPSEARVEELSTDKNLLHKPLIQKVDEPATETPVLATEKPVTAIEAEEAPAIPQAEQKPTKGRRKAKNDNAD